MINESPTNNKERYFKVVNDEGVNGARFTGDTPKQAANKAFMKMLQEYKMTGEPIPENQNIKIRESTRGSKRKTYNFCCTREQLPEPQQLVIRDKDTGTEKIITYNYRNIIKRISDDE